MRAARAGDCICYEGYGSSNQYGEIGTAGDCGHLLTPITACPGATECSGHGVCHDHPTYRCECDKGWQGGDCSERTCPFDFAWFDDPSADDYAHEMAECSNRGICNRITGECSCGKGFTGTACERSTSRFVLASSTLLACMASDLVTCPLGVVRCSLSGVPWPRGQVQRSRSLHVHGSIG